MVASNLGHPRALFGEEHADTQAVMHLLGEAYCVVKEFSKAETLLQDCLERKQKATPDDWRTLRGVA